MFINDALYRFKIDNESRSENRKEQIKKYTEKYGEESVMLGYREAEGINSFYNELFNEWEGQFDLLWKRRR